MFRVSSSKHHVSISAVAQKVNLGNLGVRNARRPKERALPFLGVLGCATLGDSWRKRGFAVVVRYAIVTDPSEDTDQSTMNQIPAFPSMSLLSPASIRATNRTILYQKNDNQSTDSDSLESLCDYSRCHNEDGFSPPPMSIQPLDYSSVSQQVNSSTTQAFKPLSTDDTLSPENASRLLGEDSGEQTDGYTEREPDGHPNSPPSIKSMIHPIVYPDDVTVTVDIQSKILNHMRRKKDYRQMKTQNSRNLSTPCMRK